METEYIYILIGVVSLIIGMFLGIQTVKFFSEELIYKLENSLESQLAFNEAYLESATEQLLNSLEQKVNFIEQINAVLGKTKELLSANKQGVEQLNEVYNTRNELEQEIVKLKNIIKRMEKKL
jgi:uncharacterized membrane-anchored protein YhcB (DUF1043 family)